MTDEQINQMIAEASGWEIFSKPLTGFGFAAYATSPNGDPSPGVPDYCNDLNAMHEAEKTLTYEQCAFFRTHLRERIKDHAASLFVWHATAHQRAEAFLRTIGKWEATDKDSLTVQPTTEQSSVVQDIGWPPPGTRISKMNVDGKWEEVKW